jgi:hypothetical protein
MTDKQFDQIMRGISVLAAYLHLQSEKAFRPSAENPHQTLYKYIDQLADAFELELKKQ